MERPSRLVSIILAVLSLVGIVGAILFLRNEKKLAQQRQDTVSSLSAELEPISEERNQWKTEDSEWQNKLSEQQKGTACVLLCFDGLEEELYNIVYKSMEAYGFKATFSLKNGKIPDGEEDCIDAEDFQEMLDNGWEYAISFVDEPQPDEGENDTEYADEENESEQVEESWLEKIDSFQVRLAENQLAVPDVLFCTQEQYDSVSETELSSRGFCMVRVLDMEEFPYISEKTDGLWKIDSGLYVQKKKLDSQLDGLIQSGNAMAISINKVVRISKDAEYDLSSAKLNALLSYLKEKEEMDQVNIFTFSEYEQYVEQQEAEYKSLISEYADFKQRMNAALEALDAKEQEIVMRAKAMVE